MDAPAPTLCRTLLCAALSLLLGGCAPYQGRITSPAALARLEGGGSMSTLWYQGSDAQFHHFRHLYKASTPYRIRRDEMPWRGEFPLGSRPLERSNSLVTDEFSTFLNAQRPADG